MGESSPRILLTGATGYVGGRLLKALERKGHAVRCLARQPVRLFIKRFPVSGRVGDALQGATQVIAPAMIGTGKRAGVAALRRADGRATMRAAVEEGRYIVICAAHQDDRLGADLARNKVPRLGDFTVVTNEDPAAVENLFQLIGKNMRVGVQRPMDPLVLNKGVVLDRINGSLLHTNPSGSVMSLLYRFVSVHWSNSNMSRGLRNMVLSPLADHDTNRHADLNSGRVNINDVRCDLRTFF